ncbi:hypothetical protein FDW83_09440 [Pseudarthrobacter sp. NamE2]|uniref:hypothetical protein n=1 Tax=Pseudarthrobacter sp. NamE2 TaxID=2576838 RepID=UPI0010FD15BB|nr:hypothetical protein [Pseudarthrobacter sp. NamE2]TLM83670.1 hypothetical protein FDW83_09440 [Pseudarthrobacter sp. NamE2]
MQLTAYIITAADQQLVLGVVELPGLRAVARNVGEILDVVQTAAAQHTGRSRAEFTVDVEF